MHLHIEAGGLAEAPELKAGDWTILPIGWPGPDMCFGVVRSVGAKSAIIHDIYFGMDVEFMLDRVEALDHQRLNRMSQAELVLLTKARRQLLRGEEELRAA